MAEKLYCEFCGGSDYQCSRCERDQAVRDRAGREEAYYAHKAARRLDAAMHATVVCVLLTLFGMGLVCAGCVLGGRPPAATTTRSE